MALTSSGWVGVSAYSRTGMAHKWTRKLDRLYAVSACGLTESVSKIQSAAEAVRYCAKCKLETPAS